MDDDETRRLILRLQMEDLASIWASSTASSNDGTELDADVSLRLYRHELRTADHRSMTESLLELLLKMNSVGEMP